MFEQIGKFPKCYESAFPLSIVVEHLLALKNFGEKKFEKFGWKIILKPAMKIRVKKFRSKKISIWLTVRWWWWSWVWSIINIPFDSKSGVIFRCVWICLENKRHNFVINIEKFFVSFDFTFSMTFISVIFRARGISITGKSTNGIF